jgi:hypothetical protein
MGIASPFALRASADAVAPRTRHCEERKRRSNPYRVTWSHGLLRGACHRARIRATRWLAMTGKNLSVRHSGARRRREPQMCNCTSGNLEIRVRCGACHRAALCADPLASPRNDGGHSEPSTMTSISFVPGRLNADLKAAATSFGSVMRIASRPSDFASPVKSTAGSTKSMPT